MVRRASRLHHHFSRRPLSFYLAPLALRPPFRRVYSHGPHRSAPLHEGLVNNVNTAAEHSEKQYKFHERTLSRKCRRVVTAAEKSDLHETRIICTLLNNHKISEWGIKGGSRGRKNISLLAALSRYDVFTQLLVSFSTRGARFFEWC